MKLEMKLVLVFGILVWRDDGLVVTPRIRSHAVRCQANKVDKAAILEIVAAEEEETRKKVEEASTSLTSDSGYLDEDDSVDFRASRSERLDLAVWRHFAEDGEKSRSYWADVISEGKVKVNGQVNARKANTIHTGDLIQVKERKSLLSSPVIPEDLELDVMYEDDDIIVINKVPGMVTHPAPGHPNGTLANALAYHCSDAAVFREARSDFRPGLVHRLDKGTSGVIVATKTPQAQASLADAFRYRKVDKTYLAVCAGGTHLMWSDQDNDDETKLPDSSSQRLIETYMARHPTKRDRMAVVPAPEDGGPPTARYARSTLRPLATDAKRSVLQVKIHTGRTHQIRVHLAHLRMPVLADDLYGDATYNKIAARPPFLARRPLLHAWTLAFPHPASGKLVSFTAPPPDDMARAIRLVSGMGEEEEES